MTEGESREEIRALLVDTLMLSVPAAEITDDRPLFGPGSLGLDSVDALQLVVELDKRYGLKIADAAVARQVLASVTSITNAVRQHCSALPAETGH
ncbi:MAG TPA: phosphopantetheine-binding protein [Verrucomicrobiota bacterium]|nr:phosphopantetheine-binding protein [Verrucomicrobiales bacterium]HRI11394.1 phosphopantetheine-binding protein [Verrucomicrobiota bacterium]